MRTSQKNSWEMPQWSLKDLENERANTQKQETLTHQKVEEVVESALCDVCNDILKQIFNKIKVVFSQTVPKLTQMSFESELSKEAIYTAIQRADTESVLKGMTYNPSKIYPRIQEIVQKTLTRFACEPENSDFRFSVQFVEHFKKQNIDWDWTEVPSRLWVNFWSNKNSNVSPSVCW